jgi:hypothetical protein
MSFKKLKIIRGFTEIKSLFELIKDKNVFICGGYARYAMSPNKNPSITEDCDLYCQDVETFESMKKLFIEKNFTVKHENEISLVLDVPVNNPDFVACPKVNLIKPRKEYRVVTQGSVEEILENFDFTVCRCAILNENEGLVDELFENDESKKFLRIMNIHCPISSAIRFCRYYKKGYWSKPIQILKLFLDWNNRDQSYRDTLIDAITKIEEYKVKQKEEENKPLDLNNLLNEVDPDFPLSEEERQQLYRLMSID